MDLRTCKIGIGKEEGRDLLVLHPRNNNDTLLVLLDTEGQLLRLSLIEVKSWMNMYAYYFDVHGSRNDMSKAYDSLDLSVGTDKFNFKLAVSKYSTPNDAYYLRLLTVRAQGLQSLTLRNVALSNDGTSRFADLIGQCNILRQLHLESNYFDPFGTELIIKNMINCFKSLNVIKIINNKIGDSLIRMLLDNLASEKSYADSSPLVDLTLSGAGISDSGILGLHRLFSEYAHSPPGFNMDLSHNILSTNSLVLISELLNRYPLVVNLNVSYCTSLDSTKNNIKHLLEKLTANKFLATIDFRGNPLEKNSIRSVLGFAANNFSLQKIHVDLDVELLKLHDLTKLTQGTEVFRFSIDDPDPKNNFLRCR